MKAEQFIINKNKNTCQEMIAEHYKHYPDSILVQKNNSHVVIEAVLYNCSGNNPYYPINAKFFLCDGTVLSHNADFCQDKFLQDWYLRVISYVITDSFEAGRVY